MEDQNKNIPTVGDWIITLIFTMIPIVNIVMYFVWAFSDGTPLAKKNWARATLVIVAIALILGIFVSVGFGFSMAALFSSV